MWLKRLHSATFYAQKGGLVSQWGALHFHRVNVWNIISPLPTEGETNEMLPALPVVIIDWLITFVLKKTPVYFSISWSQAGLFMDLNHLCLQTFFFFLCFCEHPVLSSSWWSHTVVLQTSLSFPFPLPLLLGKAPVLTDEVSFFPVGTLDPLKWYLLCCPAGPTSPYCHAEDPGLAYSFLWAKYFGESSGRVSSSYCMTTWSWIWKFPLVSKVFG